MFRWDSLLVDQPESGPSAVDLAALVSRWEEGVENDLPDPHLGNRLGNELWARGRRQEALVFYERSIQAYLQRGMGDRALAVGLKVERRLDGVAPAGILLLLVGAAAQANRPQLLEARVHCYLDYSLHQGDTNSAVKKCIDVLDAADSGTPTLDMRLARWHMEIATREEAAKRLYIRAQSYRSQGDGKAASALVSLARLVAPDFEPVVAPTKTIPTGVQGGGGGRVTQGHLPDIWTASSSVNTAGAAQAEDARARISASPAERDGKAVSDDITPESAGSALVSPSSQDGIHTAMQVPDGEDDQTFLRELAGAFQAGIERSSAAQDLKARYDIAGSFKDMEMYEEAISELRLVLKAEDGTLRVAAAEDLAECLLALGKPEDAFAVVRDILPPEYAGKEKASTYIGLVAHGIAAAQLLGDTSAVDGWNSYRQHHGMGTA